MMYLNPQTKECAMVIETKGDKVIIEINGEQKQMLWHEFVAKFNSLAKG